MKLSELIEGIELRESRNFSDREISGISTDSRSVREGDLYIALRGIQVDGNDYAAGAATAGAAALLLEREIETELPLLLVEDSSRIAWRIMRRFYNDPASRLILIGITGTNGKTSTSFLLQSILQRTLGPTGIIGTVGYGMEEGKIRPHMHTTPSLGALYRILAGFTAGSCRAAVMEVSSHAVVQGRIEGLEFDVAVFTNITRDHLDYHGTMEEYVSAKERLVLNLRQKGRRKKEGTLVYNRDDARVAAIAERFDGTAISCGFDPAARVRGESLQADLRGTRFTLVEGEQRVGINLNLLGSFSASNALLAAGAARAVGMDSAGIKAGLEGVREVPGRFQVVTSSAGPTVIIDYAHTPDALERLLIFCRELGAERVITVFGCGGDRDRGKRPMMGKLAVDLSDRVVITNDNPRTEDPGTIIGDILQGTVDSRTPVEVIQDRSRAIEKAVEISRPHDLVVLAGKGHEDYQILGERRVHLSDLVEARKALKKMEVGHQG
ncbi:MAG: UDP-N-acetylmuramoyl-L-alanyl-D-glutamate--2,6-diaminopimelate ligase [Candidatus Krumholzibacteriota bacterium]|nr:UDP-N-acetylmuramoyl-L-alanyl-D-glutamate--2,6-diaminopimelate ligase [Candidatus Krumholzibacteriota bacterium]